MSNEARNFSCRSHPQKHALLSAYLLCGVHMTIDDTIKIFDAIARLLTVVVWPAIAIFFLLRFKDAFKKFFDSISEFSFKGAGLEASVKKQIQAAASIAAVSAADRRENNTPQQAAEAASEVVLELLTKRTVKRASRTKILWVDDCPENNISQREVLQDLGITIRLAESTQQAMTLLSKENFDLVISDMGRPPDKRAGYTLLSEMRSSKITTPVIFYAAGGNLPEHRREAKKNGAFASTNGATELFQHVFSALDEH